MEDILHGLGPVAIHGVLTGSTGYAAEQAIGTIISATLSQ